MHLTPPSTVMQRSWPPRRAENRSPTPSGPCRIFWYALTEFRRDSASLTAFGMTLERRLMTCCKPVSALLTEDETLVIFVGKL